MAPSLTAERRRTSGGSTTQKIQPNLWFDTQAEDAARFYVEVFGEGSGIGVITRYGLSWQVVPADWYDMLEEPG